MEGVAISQRDDEGIPAQFQARQRRFMLLAGGAILAALAAFVATGVILDREWVSRHEFSAFIPVFALFALFFYFAAEAYRCPKCRRLANLQEEGADIWISFITRRVTYFDFNPVCCYRCGARLRPWPQVARAAPHGSPQQLLAVARAPFAYRRRRTRLMAAGLLFLLPAAIGFVFISYLRMFDGHSPPSLLPWLPPAASLAIGLWLLLQSLRCPVCRRRAGSLNPLREPDSPELCVHCGISLRLPFAPGGVHVEFPAENDPLHHETVPPRIGPGGLMLPASRYNVFEAAAVAHYQRRHSGFRRLGLPLLPLAFAGLVAGIAWFPANRCTQLSEAMPGLLILGISAAVFAASLAWGMIINPCPLCGEFIWAGYGGVSLFPGRCASCGVELR